METKKFLLTKESYDKNVQERDRLIKYLRKDIAEKIKVAREQGDLSENADYDAAMDEQAEVDSKIKELEKIINNAEIVDITDSEIDTNKVGIGATVTIRDLDYDETETYKIVGSTEADSRNGKISNESPVGAALIGHKKNDKVVVALPNGGTANYKILSIDFKA